MGADTTGIKDPIDSWKDSPFDQPEAVKAQNLWELFSVRLFRLEAEEAAKEWAEQEREQQEWEEDAEAEASRSNKDDAEQKRSHLCGKKC